MNKKNKKIYPPHLRDDMEQDPSNIKSYSSNNYTELPDPVTDPIVCNNIASAEFDYTYDEEDRA